MKKIFFTIAILLNFSLTYASLNKKNAIASIECILTQKSTPKLSRIESEVFSFQLHFIKNDSGVSDEVVDLFNFKSKNGRFTTFTSYNKTSPFIAVRLVDNKTNRSTSTLVNIDNLELLESLYRMNSEMFKKYADVSSVIPLVDIGIADSKVDNILKDGEIESDAHLYCSLTNMQ